MPLPARDRSALAVTVTQAGMMTHGSLLAFNLNSLQIIVESPKVFNRAHLALNMIVVEFLLKSEDDS